jgi:hypothetical protein
MEAQSHRRLTCPKCRRTAIVILSWDPQSAWKAHVNHVHCPNRCEVPAETILDILGLAR